MATFIIAEAGVNHNGRLEVAKEMISAAALAGANAVKFQTFRAEELVSPTASKVTYQIENTDADGSQLEMLRGFELSSHDFAELFDYCSQKKISFLSTPFDDASADMLEELGMSMFKIPSGELTNKSLLQHIATKGKPIILSTGMSYIEEIAKAIGWINEVWDRLENGSELTLLHCVSSYPAPMDEVNLLAMKTLADKFHLPVGYSDHTQGIEIPIAGVALGATVIEKHFTLSRDLPGPDHQASLEPNELASMIRSIRNLEIAFGDGVKRPVPSELETRKLTRRILVSANKIKRGDILHHKDIRIQRAGDGILPEYFQQVEGRRAKKAIAKGAAISWQDLEDLA